MYQLILLIALLSTGNCFWDHHGHGWGHGHGHPHGDWNGHGPGHGDWNDHGPGHGDWNGPGPGHGDWNGPGPGHGDWNGPGPGHGDWHRSGCPFNGDGKMSYDCNFYKLSSDVIRADRYAKHFCESHKQVQVQEVYGDSSYKLIYSVPTSHVDKISVKINHRVIYMRAVQSGPNQSETYVDLRILPQMVKIAEATWKYENDRVTVEIPYKVTLGTQIQTVCTDVNENIINVENTPSFIYRSGTPQ